MRVLSIAGCARKDGTASNVPWATDTVADVEEAVEAAEKFVSPAAV